VQKILFYGGSFDPPHRIHRALLAAALELTQADLALVVPTGNASSYKSRALTPALHRLAMCKLAFADVPRVQISDMEANSTQPNYTIETLAALEQRMGADVQWFLLLGADQFALIHTWRRWQDLLAKVTLVVAERPGSPSLGGPSYAREEKGQQSRHNSALCNVLYLPLQPDALSSTAIRHALRDGSPSPAQQRQLKDALDVRVLRYIANHLLYSSIDTMATAKKSTKKIDTGINDLQLAIVTGLEDVKAVDIQVFDTEHQTSLFERVMIASGNSNRQTRALAMSVLDKVKEAGFPKPRVEGLENGEWIIVDCGMAVCHIMQPMIRAYYHLEDIWGEKVAKPVKDAAKKATTKTKAKPAAEKKPVAKKAVAKKAVSKTLASSAPAKKAPVKKVAAKKAASKTVAAPAAAPAKKVAAKKVAAKKAVAAKAPAAPAAPAKKAAAKKTVAKKVALKKAAAK